MATIRPSQAAESFRHSSTKRDSRKPLQAFRSQEDVPETAIETIPVARTIPVAGTTLPVPYVGIAICVAIVLLAVSGFLRYLSRNVIMEHVPLPSDGSLANVKVLVKNCVTTFKLSEMGEESWVEIRGWKAFLEDSSSFFVPPPPEATTTSTSTTMPPPKPFTLLRLWKALKELFRQLLPPAAGERFGGGGRSLLQGRWPSMNRAKRRERKLTGILDWGREIRDWWKKNKGHAFIPENTDQDETSRTWRWMSDDELLIAMHMRSWNPYFQCVVDFHLAPSYQFKSLTVKSAPADAYVQMVSKIAIKASEKLEMSALHANLNLRSLEAKSINLSVRDGSINFALDGDPSSYDYLSADALVVDSKTAPVTIESSIPIDLTLDYKVASRAFVRGFDVLEERDAPHEKIKLTTWTQAYSGVLASTDFHSLSLVTRAASESPIYLVAREKGSNLNEMELLTWSGTEQMDQPHLLAYSATLVQNVHQWIEFQPATPWVGLINPLGLYIPEGIWRIVSSDAFLTGNNWFVLFSGGLLQPRIKRIQAHVMGLFCRSKGDRLTRQSLADFTASYNVDDASASDDSEKAETLQEVSSVYKKRWPEIYPGRIIGTLPHHQTCLLQIMEEIYVVLWKAFEASRTPSTMFVWADADGSETRFTLASDTVVRDSVTITDTWLFLVATGINLTMSLSAGFLACKYLLPLFISYLRDEENVLAAANAASHRLHQTIQEVPPAEWTVNVSRLFRPVDGFALRWNYTLPPETDRLALHIMPTSKLAKDGSIKSLLSAKNLPVDDESAKGSEEAMPLLPPQPAAEEEGYCETVIYLPLSSLKTTRVFAVVQAELFVPMKHPGLCQMDTSQSYTLWPLVQYRMKVAAHNASSREIRSSAWTSELVPGASPSSTELPLSVLRKLVHLQQSSLDLFVQKHCILSSPILNQIIASELVLEIYNEHAHAENSTIISPSEHIREVDLELHAYFGALGEGALRRQQSQKMGRAIHNIVKFKGIPILLRTENSVDVYQISTATNDLYLYENDRLAFDAINFEVLDTSTGHVLATATSHVSAFMGQCIAQNDPTHPDSAYGLCWRPFWYHTLNRGRDAQTPWGRLGCRLDARTARQMSRHDMTPKNAMTHPERGFIRFENDASGAIYPEGSEMVINWSWEAPKRPAQIHLHLHDHATNELIMSLQNGRPIPNTGSFCWGVEVDFVQIPITSRSPFVQNAPSRQRRCYFTLTLGPHQKGVSQDVLAQSNSFFVLKVLTLSFFEFAYAAFCRTNNLEMDHVSAECLRDLGIDVYESPLKVCPDLREGLPFEDLSTYAHCPGQCVISTASKVLRLCDPLTEVSGQTDAASNESKSVQVYKSVSLPIAFLENCALRVDPTWWTGSPDIAFVRGRLLDAKIFSLVETTVSKLQNNPVAHLLQSRKPQDDIAVQAEASRTHLNRSLDMMQSLKFDFVPKCLQVVAALYQVGWFCAWPSLMGVLFVMYDYGLVALTQISHNSTSPLFLSDIVFARSFAFFFAMPAPAPHIFVTTSLWMFFMTVAVFAEPILRVKPGCLSSVIYRGATALQILNAFMLFTLLSTFLLWFFLGGLINSDAFLPYAVMLGCIGFVTYTLWCNHTQARELVLNYIEKNQQTLLSVSFDRWFEAHKISFDQEVYFRELNATSQNIRAFAKSNRKMKYELMAWRQRKVRQLNRMKVREVKNKIFNSQAASAESDASGHSFLLRDSSSDNSLGAKEEIRIQKSLAAKLRHQLCWWSIDKVHLNENDGYFTLDKKLQPLGLNLIPNLPDGTRFATLKEAERNRGRLEELLLGFDVALLADGVKYGPRFGYKVDKHPTPSQKFTTAIVAVPRWPPASDLEDFMKLSLIFDYFDGEQKGYWQLSDFLKWVSTCQKASALEASATTRRHSQAPEAMSSRDERGRDKRLFELFQNIVNRSSDRDHAFLSVEPTDRIRPSELEMFYLLDLDMLDDDYTELFVAAADTLSPEVNRAAPGILPLDRPHVQDDAPPSLDETEDYDVDDEEDSASDLRDMSDHDESGDVFAAKPEQTEGGAALEAPAEKNEKTNGADHSVEDALKERVKANINGLKLQYIFKYLTKRSRGERIESLIKSIPFLAEQLVECQYSLLAPIFSADVALTNAGPNALTRECSVLRGTTAENSKTRQSDNLFMSLKLIHLDVVEEFTADVNRLQQILFEPANTQRGIAKFYDNTVVSEIQLKAARLTDYRIEITAAELHSSNRWIVTSTKPVSARQALRKFGVFRSRRIVKVRELLLVLSQAGPHQLPLQISLISFALLEAGVLRSCEVSKTSQTLMLVNGTTKTVDVWTPRSAACTKFLEKVIHQTHANEIITVAHLTRVVEKILGEYLFLYEFRALLALLGLDLRRDELPGRVWLNDSDLEQEDALSDFQHLIIDILNITQTGNEHHLLRQSLEDPAAFQAGSTTERKNLFKIKRIFDQFSNDSMFLPVDLADEAILLLTDNRMSQSAVMACLRDLKIGNLNMSQSDNIINALTELGLSSTSPALILEARGQSGAAVSTGELQTLLGGAAAQGKWSADDDDFDWTHHVIESAWPPELSAQFRALTASYPGFMGKSQLAEFVEFVRSYFQAEQMSKKERRAAQVVSFEMFHRVAIHQGYAISRRHSRILWILICAELHPLLKKSDVVEVVEILPLQLVAQSLARIQMQPNDAEGSPITLESLVARSEEHKEFRTTGETPMNLIAAYEGYLTERLFRKLIKYIGIDIHCKGVHNLWCDLDKDPMSISHFLPEPKPGDRCEKYLRVNMDRNGLDPHVGHHLQIGRMRRSIPRLLVSGFWPSALRLLLKVYLNLDKLTDENIQRVVDQDRTTLNRYGMVRPGAIPWILTMLNFEGMSFESLKELIGHMRLALPLQAIKRMFDTLDVNHDHSLDLTELLSGFELLLSRLLPASILQEVGLSTGRLLMSLSLTIGGLVIFFVFTALSFTSFVAVSTGASTAVQSLLALAGAVGLQSGASQDQSRVDIEMRARLEAAIGGDGKSGAYLEEKMARNLKIMEEIAKRTAREGARKARQRELRPAHLEYVLPKGHEPDSSDARPCLTLRPGDSFRIEPVLLLACGVEVTSPVSTLTTARENRSGLDETRLLLKKGLKRISSSDALLTWTITPPLPRHSCLVFDSTTGVIESVQGERGSGCRPMSRKTFLITARNPGGSMTARLTLQVVPHANSKIM